MGRGGSDVRHSEIGISPTHSHSLTYISHLSTSHDVHTQYHSLVKAKEGMMVKGIAVISFIIVLLSLPTVSSFSSSQKSNERQVRRYASSSTEETSQMTLPLSGKTAFITGSSGGIGKAIASRFAKAGAHVILHNPNILFL